MKKKVSELETTLEYLVYNLLSTASHVTDVDNKNIDAIENNKLNDIENTRFIEGTVAANLIWTSSLYKILNGFDHKLINLSDENFARLKVAMQRLKILQEASEDVIKEALKDPSLAEELLSQDRITKQEYDSFMKARQC